MVVRQVPESGYVVRGALAGKAWCEVASAWYGAAVGHHPGWNPNYFLLDCEGQERVKTPGHPTASSSQDLPPRKCLKPKRRLWCREVRAVKLPRGSGPERLSFLRLSHGLKSKPSNDSQACPPPTEMMPRRDYRWETSADVKPQKCPYPCCTWLWYTLFFSEFHRPSEETRRGRTVTRAATARRGRRVTAEEGRGRARPVMTSSPGTFLRMLGQQCWGFDLRDKSVRFEGVPSFTFLLEAPTPCCASPRVRGCPVGPASWVTFPLAMS